MLIEFELEKSMHAEFAVVVAVFFILFILQLNVILIMEVVVRPVTGRQEIVAARRALSLLRMARRA